MLSPPFRIIAAALAVLLLTGGWLYLYLRARDVDLKGQNEILGYLRQLKEVDARWNDRLIGVRSGDITDPHAAEAPITPGALGILQHKLNVQAQNLANPLLNQSLAALRTSFADKSNLVAAFWSAQTALRQSLTAYNEAATAMQVSGRGTLAAARLSGSLSGYLNQPTAESAKVVEAAAAGAGNEELARHARDIVTRKGAEEQSFRQASNVSTGTRIDTLTGAFEREFENALDEGERYRVYLLFYSGLVLTLLAYAGGRLISTYRLVQRMNHMLRDANEGLEHRVEERTAELSRAMSQLKESEALLIQSEKMSSLGMMVAGVAHELNTPLAYVKSSLENLSHEMPHLAELEEHTGRLVELLQADAPDEQRLAAQFNVVEKLIRDIRTRHVLPELQSLLGDGLHGVTQISELVVNLRNFARLDRSKVAEFDLNEGLEGALAMARSALKRRTVRKELGRVPRISCSPSQINQVFLNLVTNAAQATSEQGGVVTVRTGVNPDRTVFFEIEDNGHGIPDEVLPKIFDPFFTTKEVGQGTGLGLSIVYKIVEQHGGTVAVASKVGVGTRFIVSLPADASAQVRAGGGAAAGVRAATAG
jgi:two-component system NtrC family sensor kinase